MSDLKEKLSKYGIDYEDALDRVDGDEDFYKTLAMKYLTNENYVSLVAAMEVKDYDEAYKAAHALKGISGNLSFNDLFKVASEMSAALYQGEYQAAEKMLPQVTKYHKEVLEGLEKWSNGEL